ncbi:hypothetical protein V1499_23050 (plasmid) [Neobacillus sp. SCS-31]|uniref:hypothetical protein n=1 Tax=Neobacillus oceani TaxID=3115292 RepID=UPI003906CEAC
MGKFNDRKTEDLSSKNPNRPIIPPETERAMAVFFRKTSIPRILAKIREEENMKNKKDGD